MQTVSRSGGANPAARSASARALPVLPHDRFVAFFLRELAEHEALEGEYSCVKIINADTNEDVEYFTKARR